MPDEPSPISPSPGISSPVNLSPAPIARAQAARDSRFEEALDLYGPALERLARAWEADADTRRDLLQEVHIALWRSLEAFDGRCSLRTWVYRVAHNTAASHVAREMRLKQREFIGIEDLAQVPDQGPSQTGNQDQLAILYTMIHQLKPLDRQVMLAYLEGLDAASTAEITGLSASNVATKIHRIKHLLAQRMNKAATPQTRDPRPQTPSTQNGGPQ